MYNESNKFEENKQNVNINEQQEVAQVENNEKSMMDSAREFATSKTGKGIGITLAVTAIGYATWKWVIPTVKKHWPGKKNKQPANDGFEVK